jgi:hypothetical protein
MAKFNGLDFDPDIFSLLVESTPDTTRTAFMEAGILVPSQRIQETFSGGGAKATIPMYAFDLGTEAQEWDGSSDLVPITTGTATQSAVVINRAKAWKQDDLSDIVSNGVRGDVFRNLAERVGKWRSVNQQKKILATLSGIFAMTPTDGGFAASWLNHTLDISASGTPTDDNRVGVTTINELTAQANGDNHSIYGVVIAHSLIAKSWRNQQLVDYIPYTDPAGVQSPALLEYVNGLRLLEDDSVTVTGAGVTAKYSTYVLGSGAFLTSGGPLLDVSEEYETDRDALVQGGLDYFVTRYRVVFHPNGCSFKIDPAPKGATDAQLSAGASWDAAFDPKGIAIARVISNA